MASKFPAEGFIARTFYLAEDEFSEFQCILKFEDSPVSSFFRSVIKETIENYKQAAGIPLDQKLTDKNIAEFCQKGTMNDAPSKKPYYRKGMKVGFK